MDKKEFEKAIKEFKTPAYIFDLDILKERVLLIKQILSPACTCFAMKANPFLIKPMDEYTDRFEVCSPGEYEICMRQGIAPDKIVVSGVNKTEQSMDRIMQLSEGKGIFTIESLAHYRILSACAQKYERKISVYVRLSSGNQFGMDKKTLEQVIANCQKDKYLSVLGIHYYSGTQKKIKKVDTKLRKRNSRIIGICRISERTVWTGADGAGIWSGTVRSIF